MDVSDIARKYLSNSDFFESEYDDQTNKTGLCGGTQNLHLVSGRLPVEKAGESQDRDVDMGESPFTVGHEKPLSNASESPQLIDENMGEPWTNGEGQVIGENMGESRWTVEDQAPDGTATLISSLVSIFSTFDAQDFAVACATFEGSEDDDSEDERDEGPDLARGLDRCNAFFLDQACGLRSPSESAQICIYMHFNMKEYA